MEVANRIAQIRAEIREQESLYLDELKTSQRYENLKAIRVKINALSRELLLNDGTPDIHNLPSID